MTLRAKELLDEILECEGAEVYEYDWPYAEELVRTNFITLGPARGPDNAWRRAELVEGVKSL